MPSSKRSNKDDSCQRETLEFSLGRKHCLCQQGPSPPFLRLSFGRFLSTFWKYLEVQGGQYNMGIPLSVWMSCGSHLAGLFKSNHSILHVELLDPSQVTRPQEMICSLNLPNQETLGKTRGRLWDSSGMWIDKTYFALVDSFPAIHKASSIPPCAN